MFERISLLILKILSEFLEIKNSDNGENRRFKNHRKLNRLIRQRARLFRFLRSQLKKEKISIDEYKLLRDALLITIK